MPSAPRGAVCREQGQRGRLSRVFALVVVAAPIAMAGGVITDAVVMPDARIGSPAVRGGQTSVEAGRPVLPILGLPASAQSHPDRRPDLAPMPAVAPPRAAEAGHPDLLMSVPFGFGTAPPLAPAVPMAPPIVAAAPPPSSRIVLPSTRSDLRRAASREARREARLERRHEAALRKVAALRARREEIREERRRRAAVQERRREEQRRDEQRREQQRRRQPQSPWRFAPHVTWYGPGFYGQRTACGQIYTRRIIGVAHRTLPCGTLVQLRWRGITAVAPVIDRGPYSPMFVFDFSAALMCDVFRPPGVRNACFTRHNVHWRIVGRAR